MIAQEEIVAPRVRTAERTRTARPLNVCLLISSLEFGGAERQVVEMTRTFDRARVTPFICSLSKEVPLAANLENAQRDLVVLPKRGRFDAALVLRLAKLLRERRVDVVHAFLLDAEIAARLAAPLAGVRAVIASERNTDYVRPRLHTIALKATQPLFRVMVANSFAGKQFNVRTLGLAPSRIEVVHNGVDVERFRPDRTAGETFRRKTGLSLTAPVIGMVGSFKRQKAHDCFLRMARKVADTHPDAKFLLVGEPLSDDLAATSEYQSEIRALTTSLKLAERCVFLPNQQDMRSVYNACDVTVLLSRHEGTPNVLLESMACGVPVVASNIADNAVIVRDGETGYIVPRDDHSAAALRVESLLADSSQRQAMGIAARSRVCSDFSLDRAASKLEEIYARALSRQKRTEDSV
jgi:glycosyltransferase involved in cell wall biosynthesis